ncbi:unnamed protein product [Ambrosiozyma monospora]|uniref:Unnamed protein product n=1 Tax=Ambrosiozyma monospora TaxID=43982 RepID=A0ACB5TNG7_AMBMO|nr:unnamed protein product [Ambrosiozyma monospora]
MGNTPTKEIRPSVAASLSNNPLSVLASSASGSSTSKKRRDKYKKREEHLLNLIVRAEETVDGGFLAPFGNYNYNLTYKSAIVRNMIIERRLAPFYTPLEEFDPSWTDDELLEKLYSMHIHAKISIEDFENFEEDEEEDPDDHKIYHSMNSIKRKENKLFKKNFKKKLIVMQNEENSRT